MAKLKVVIINPITEDLSSSPTLGAAYVAGAIERAGYEVSIIDANSRLGNYSLESLCKEVRELKPDVLGFSFCTVQHMTWVYRQMQVLKKFAGLTIAGGPHPTVLPDDVKFGNGYNKYFFLKVLPTSVPDDIRWRRAKNGMGVSPAFFFQNHREIVQDSVLSSQLVREIMDLGALQEEMRIGSLAGTVLEDFSLSL